MMIVLINLLREYAVSVSVLASWESIQVFESANTMTMVVSVKFFGQSC